MKIFAGPSGKRVSEVSEKCQFRTFRTLFFQLVPRKFQTEQLQYLTLLKYQFNCKYRNMNDLRVKCGNQVQAFAPVEKPQNQFRQTELKKGVRSVREAHHARKYAPQIPQNRMNSKTIEASLVSLRRSNLRQSWVLARV
jgi:hypothetical protein